MAWIESHQSLGRHPKLKRLAKLLDVSLPTAVGHLHYLWWWALDFAESGDLSNFTPEELAAEALWEGDPQRFVGSLREAGFLDANGQLHDWDEYTGRLVDKRQTNRERQRAYRERKRITQKAREHNGDVTVTSPLRHGATVPNPTVPNSTSSSGRSNMAGIQEGQPTRQAATPAAPVVSLERETLPMADGAAYRLYLDTHGGQINPVEADNLRGLVQGYGDLWVAEAITTAVVAGCRSPSIKYLTSICSRWRRDGFKVDGRNGRSTAGEGEAEADSYSVDESTVVMLGRRPSKGVL